MATITKICTILEEKEKDTSKDYNLAKISCTFNELLNLLGNVA